MSIVVVTGVTAGIGVHAARHLVGRIAVPEHRRRGAGDCEAT
ncbi:hypothetical protein [Streptomyces adelaidensis]|nr:hypothetical protein [Streptomyces adelaidensis]